MAPGPWNAAQSRAGVGHPPKANDSARPTGVAGDVAVPRMAAILAVPAIWHLPEVRGDHDPAEAADFKPLDRG